MLLGNTFNRLDARARLKMDDDLRRVRLLTRFIALFIGGIFTKRRRGFFTRRVLLPTLPAPYLSGKSCEQNQRQGQCQVSEKILSVHHITSNL